MAAPVNFYADFKGLASLKNDAGKQDPKALREAARQFESLFTQMMLKSMREASKTFQADNPLAGGDQTDFYRDMFDSQMAVQMSKGKGLGLGDMLVRQLKGAGAKAEAALPENSKIEIRDSGFEIGQKTESRFKPLPATVVGVNHAVAQTKQFSSIPSNVVGVNHEMLQPAPTAAMHPSEGDMNFNSQEITDPSQLSSLALQVARLKAQEASDSSTANLESRISNLDTVTLEEPAPEHPTVPTKPSDFVTQLWPHAKAAADELGIDPHMLIAQAALETGWGKSIPCNPDGTCSFNLFGIKAGSRWQGSSVGVTTLEFEDGVAVQRRASFRAYESPADSFRDYAALIKNSPRYASAIGAGSDVAAFANALQRGGYATDPNYATKLTAVAERLRLTLMRGET